MPSYHLMGLGTRVVVHIIFVNCRFAHVSDVSGHGVRPLYIYFGLGLDHAGAKKAPLPLPVSIP